MGNAYTGYQWTDAKKARVRELWDEGHTATIIASHLGRDVTKNMILGIAHRMGLPSRPNPAARDKLRNALAPQNRRWIEAKEHTVREMWQTQISTADIANMVQMRLTSVYAKAKALGLPLRTWASNIKPKDAAERLATREPVIAPDSLNIPMGDLRANGCRYPTSKERPHLFCGAKANPGHPFCCAHEQVCYVARSIEPAVHAAVASTESLSA